MTRTWVIVEDNQSKCEAYLLALISCPERWLTASDKVRFITLARYSLKSDLSLAVSYTGAGVTLDFDDAINAESRVGVFTIEKSEDLIKVIDKIGKQHLLIILDVELPKIQDRSVFENEKHILNMLYRRLHKDDSNGNLILLATAERDGKSVVDIFKPENPRRFKAGPNLGLNYEQGESQHKAREVLANAHHEWINLHNPASRLLQSIVMSQNITKSGPGHPSTWYDVPQGCELKNCFNEEDPVEFFKGVFWYNSNPDRIGGKDPSVAVFRTPGRYVKAQNIVNILKNCGLTVEHGGSEDMHILLPGAVGGVFLWRLLRFMGGLKPSPECVVLAVENERASISFKVENLPCFAAALFTRINLDGDSVQNFKHLLLCEPPNPEEIVDMGDNSAREQVSLWKTPAHECGQSNQSRGHYHPLMVPEFLYQSSELRLWWRFKAYKPASD